MQTTTKKAKAMVLNAMAVDDLIAQGKPIWISNRTHHLLVLSFTDGGAAPVSVNIEDNPAPFCLNNYVPPALIKQSPHIRRLIAQGSIVLLDPDTVDPHGKTAKAMKHIYGESDEGGAGEDTGETVEPYADIKAQPKVVFWVSALQNGDRNTEKFLVELEKVKHSLTEDDYVFISQECASNHKVANWAINGLAELRESGEDEKGVARGDGADEDEPSISGAEDNIDKVASELQARSQITTHSAEGHGRPVGSDGMTDEQRKGFKKTFRAPHKW